MSKNVIELGVWEGTSSDEEGVDKNDPDAVEELFRKRIQKYTLLAELKLVELNHISGVYLLPKKNTRFVWYGFICVRSGYYFGGIFNFSIEIPSCFPSHKVPTVYLPKGFYHPHVNRDTGEVCLKTLCPEWDPVKSHFFQLLHKLRRLLTVPTSCMFDQMSRLTYRQHLRKFNRNDYWNPDAAVMLLMDKDNFEIKARKCVQQQSVWSIHQNLGIPAVREYFRRKSVYDISSLTDDALMERARESIKSFHGFHSGEICAQEGCSWIDPEKMTIFSKQT